MEEEESVQINLTNPEETSLTINFKIEVDLSEDDGNCELFKNFEGSKCLEK